MRALWNVWRRRGSPAQVREFVLFIPASGPALPELETLWGAGTSGSWAMKRTLFMRRWARLRHRRAQRYRLFATGRDKAGRTATAGGWGPLFSDEGSGYHIGVLCLSRLALLHDTHVTGTLLEKNVLEMLGLPDVLSIRDAAYRPDFTRRHVARLSYAVERSAREGDANACAVLDEAACALARLAATVAGQLDADGLPVALTGGVARMGELFTGRFRRALEHLVPQCVYQPAKYSPVVGAALCVLSESAGVDITAPAPRKI
ncbi:MAG: BadF/BadG/BcrA/BcrD ATPase family protein [Ruthenibacterium lactatiformans]